MSDSIILRVMLPLGFVLFCAYELYRLVSNPGGMDSYLYLAALIAVEMFAVALWNYQRVFFAIVIVVFLCAGTFLGVSGSARWLVLSVGAVAGFAIYMKKSPSFGAVHLLALSCVITASVSAMVSSYPRLALLKTVSLLLLFLYGATGARLAALDREAKFAAGLLLGCEVLVYITGASYFILHARFFGNPNSLGAVTGMATTPILVWGLIISEGTRAYPRRLFAATLSLLLLLSSYSRAGIGAGVVATLVICLVLRRYRLLVKGAGVALLAAVLVAATVPLSDTHDIVQNPTLVDTFLYKGKVKAGLFGSRETPWQKTFASIKRNPWFGTGFGTSASDEHGREFDFAVRSMSGSVREHGDSYLAILEWVGMLGVIPFLLLILFTAWNAFRGLMWVRRTNNPASLLLPVSAVLLGSVLHAFFEDWMFAPGYYMCVFFWALVFIQVDLLPVGDSVPVTSVNQSHSATYDPRYGMVSAGR